MTYTYKTHGTCSRKITIDLDGTIIKRVAFEGGCAGNAAGLSKLVEGQEAQQVISSLAGIRCGLRPTSCPDQLSIALREALSAGAQAKQAQL